ncbi:hypothetical protein [Turicibacter sp.]|uniref:hypothetical protein n=1 Tax=Turicibacter sp. TaxID=2049042 RepID=UPI001B489967|nr:hypothetical protein [Turicibacter sp.]MBP3903577.1 hypothetical protein [Turicibacter sp.]
MNFCATNYTGTVSKYQEDLLEVIRDIMITELQDKLSDLQWSEERGEITDKIYISHEAKKLNNSIDRLRRAYNPCQENE